MKVAHQGGFASYTFGSETLFRQLHIAGKFVDYPYSSKSTQYASDVRHILDYISQITNKLCHYTLSHRNNGKFY